MKTLLLILFLIAFSTTSFSQSKIIFQDDFSDNSNNWKLYDNKDFLVEIKKGKLHIQKFEINKIKHGCLWYSKPIPGFNTAKDFSIIFSAKAISYGDTFEGIDLQWGAVKACDTCKNTGSLFQLDITPKNVRLSYFSQKPTYFQRSSDSYANVFKENRFNKYEINQTGDLITVKVNNKEIYRQQIEIISGGSLGIQQCTKASWEIDDILIKQ